MFSAAEGFNFPGVFDWLETHGASENREIIGLTSSVVAMALKHDFSSYFAIFMQKTANAKARGLYFSGQRLTFP